MRLLSRRLAVAATLSAGLLSIGLSASAQNGAPVTAEDMTQGNPKAPVTIVEYGSAACSHCAAWAKDVYPAFKAKYIDTGKVRYVFREAITSPPQLAAVGFMLARCAGKDKYFATLDGVFHAQEQVFATGDIKAPLLAVAAKAGFQPLTSKFLGLVATNGRAGDLMRFYEINDQWRYAFGLTPLRL